MKIEAKQVKRGKAVLLDTVDHTGKLRTSCFDVTIPNNCLEIEIVLAKLPPGRLRLLGDLSLIELIVKKLETVNVGWYGHKVHLQGKLPSVKDGLNKNVTKKMFKLGTQCPARTKVFNTHEGLYISTHLKGNFLKGDKVIGYIIYVKD